MITIQAVYVLVGALFVVFAVLSARDTANPRRWTTALFWALFAVSFLAGDFLGDFGNGILVLCMALVAGFGGLSMGKSQRPPRRNERQARPSAAMRCSCRRSSFRWSRSLARS